MTKSINDLLRNITDEQMATQRQLAKLQQVTSSQKTSMKLVMQKIKEERGYTFRTKEQKQWCFNKVVDSHISNTLYELKKIPWSTDQNTAKIMDNIQEELTKGWEEIANHQKKLKMADRSEYSWGMVEAYKCDELVDDSTDEKRMEKAEKSATKRSRVPSTSRQEEPEQKRQPDWE